MFLVSQTCTLQSAAIKYELQAIQQERQNLLSEATEIQEAKSDCDEGSVQYQRLELAEKRINEEDTDLEVRQNEIELSLKMLESWGEAEEEETSKSIEKFFSK